MPTKSAIEQAKAVLDGNRLKAHRLVQEAGAKDTVKLLGAAQRDLEQRLKMAEGLRGPGKDSFSAMQVRATLAQVRAVQVNLNRGLRGVLLTHGPKAAELGAEGTATYLAKADQEFRGVGTQPLALKAARMLAAGREGSEASILRRLAGDDVSPARPGILSRYGTEVVGHFEKTLQKGLVARKSLAEMRDDITEDSPFLQGAPRSWADRIVRTELMGARNRGQWEATREADEQLGDLVKILSATFDDRTAADSYAVHGQIRRPEEPFETWQGPLQHPPARSNDREIVVPHRLVWPIPPYLAWKEDEEVYARWQSEQPKKSKVKREMPPRPLMTTVPLSDFGKEPVAASSESVAPADEEESDQ